MKGIALEKNGPCSWENEVKNIEKKMHNGQKRPYFSHLGGTRNGTSGARIKIVKPLFNTN